MSKKVVIHQPDFLPHLAFFHRLLNIDLYVIFDSAQFVDGTSRSWMHRDQIKTAQGKKWLSLSVEKANRNTPIKDIQLSTNVDWRANNLNLLHQNYDRAPFSEEIFPYIDELYSNQTNSLVEFNLFSIKTLSSLLDINVETCRASELHAQGSSNALLVELLAEVGATTYLSGIGARDYFDPKPFDAANIKVEWQKFDHPNYTQLHGEFIPYLSSVDILFCCGIEKSREILRNC